MNRLHHIAVGTSDVERLAAFYRDVLGLPEVARHDDEAGQLRAIWLDLGGSLLMLERSAAARERVEGVGSGLFLLALRVGVEERGRFEQALSARGHAIEARTSYSSYARDPDGNRIAFSHHPETEAALG